MQELCEDIYSTCHYPQFESSLQDAVKSKQWTIYPGLTELTTHIEGFGWLTERWENTKAGHKQAEESAVLRWPGGEVIKQVSEAEEMLGFRSMVVYEYEHLLKLAASSVEDYIQLQMMQELLGHRLHRAEIYIYIIHSYKHTYTSTYIHICIYVGY